ncbi:helix-turn-helix transcriptional regulator [Acinetobacter cumulans]|uniref:Helix-turn-helix transcriptional regulator n=1 Tax=Acinetobacter cumulans TaxID=2136182 RepID=A0A3A8GIF2_9GAMM|nr:MULTISPECIES: helix-turn-helix transcriptional regulator [Acinetobacter]RKG44880.1 helix-turn-helix transcriptional regulator [Acinetobacter sp. WCHAc060007]RKG55260.1 helix-turn-helix transcriptional regulator [Acinetobacter cumulans]
MSSIRDRIIQRMTDLKLKQVDLMEATGATKGAVSKWVSGTNVPRSEFMPALSKVLKTTENWLLTGNSVIELTQVEPWDSNTPLDDDEVEIPFFKDFSFACGGGSISEAIANETRKLRMSKATLRNLSITKENAVAATAMGDSMNPTIKDGDTIHVDLGRKNIKDGKIFAICFGGLFYCKRLYNLPLGGIRIVSDNSVEYPEIHLSAQDVIDQQLEIIGWVWQISSLESW